MAVQSTRGVQHWVIGFRVQPKFTDSLGRDPLMEILTFLLFGYCYSMQKVVLVLSSTRECVKA